MGNRFKKSFKKDVLNFIFIRSIYGPCNDLEHLKIYDQIFGDRRHYYDIDYVDEWFDCINLSNHRFCHKMFKDAINGKSRMFIQMNNLIRYNLFGEKTDDKKSRYVKETVTLHCSLVTVDMLAYDSFMFSAMRDTEDQVYKDEAIKHYRPYFFGFVVEIDWKKYEEIKKMQMAQYGQDSEDTYVWMECRFENNSKTDVNEGVNISGYILQSASKIEKKKNKNIRIIDNSDHAREIIKLVSKEYKSAVCVEKDNDFIQRVEKNIGNNLIEDIEVYKIGNGNCVFAYNRNNGFFYDIGFHCKGSTSMFKSGKCYNYDDSVREIAKKEPSFFILSHWHMDHIAGSGVIKKANFDKDWFAPDCHDACANAMRLANYIGIKNHLFLANRSAGRLIGNQIDIIDDKNNRLATYKLYMGAKEGCDKSPQNREGIVIEYTKYTSSGDKVVLMMGDVNYKAFNKARDNNNKEAGIADSQIEYLIVPHHGSQHTDYGELVNQNSNSIKRGELAIICCTNEPSKDRPNDAHRKKLEERFEVITTEEIPKGDVSKRITL